MLLKEGKTESMIFGNSIRVKKTAPLNIQTKETSINQTSFHKCLEAHLGLSTGTKSELQFQIQKAQFQIAIAVKTTPKSDCKSPKK